MRAPTFLALQDGKMAWLVDFVGYSRKNAPPIKMTVHTVHILQVQGLGRLGASRQHLPLRTRLGKAAGSPRRTHLAG